MLPAIFAGSATLAADRSLGLSRRRFAHYFRGRSEVGDGELHRCIADLQRQYFRAPTLNEARPPNLLIRSLLLFVADVIHSKHVTGTILHWFVSGGIGYPKNRHISVVCFALFYGL